MALYEQFMREMKTKKRTGSTIITLEQSLKVAQDKFEIPIENLTFEQLHTHIESLSKNLSDNTLALRVSKFLQFYKYCFDVTEDAKYFKLLKELKRLDISKIKGNKLKPSDILLPEDIKRLINVATLERDRCIVAVLFESGMRMGELLALTNNMVKMADEQQHVTFEIPDEEGCKTGSRIVLCSEIYGFVTDWMKCNTSDRFMPLSKRGLHLVLKKLFKRANIKKPSNPHSFRHSAITNAVNIGMQTNAICMRFWGSTSSTMLDTYIHLSESMQSNAYLTAKGLSGSESKIINPLASRCVSCGKLIQSGNLCVTCKENAELKIKMTQQGYKLTDDEKRLIELETQNSDLKRQMQDMDKKIEFFTNLTRQHFETLKDKGIPVKEPDS